MIYPLNLFLELILGAKDSPNGKFVHRTNGPSFITMETATWVISTSASRPRGSHSIREAPAPFPISVWRSVASDPGQRARPLGGCRIDLTI